MSKERKRPWWKFWVRRDPVREEARRLRREREARERADEVQRKIAVRHSLES